MIEFICNCLVTQGVNPVAAGSLARGILTVLAIVLSIIANFAAKRLILKGLAHIIVRTETKWDDIFLERKVFDKLSHLAPA
ncbi:MAG: mechanosensitive ion channel family protein, partial [Deltaproteobacteria bacterium]|nr:mechanosensitive ion channel family protein [Deltaproteobacteria bacterium]